MTNRMKRRVIALSTSLVILGGLPLSASAEEVHSSQTDQLSVAHGENGMNGLSYSNFNLQVPDHIQINEAEVSENETMLLEEYKHQHDETEELNKMKEAKKGEVAEEEAISNIESAFETVDGRNDGSTRQMKPIIKPRAVQFSAPSTKKYGTIAGVPFVEWIVPKGNTDIRPANPMKARYITIHETANTARGANAENHAKYLYKQATEGTFRTASWHFTVDDKQIYQHLPTNENGWHAGDGDGSGNRESIGIEIAVNQDGDYNKALENAKRLVGYLMNKEGIGVNNIYKHQQWSGKKCPDILISRGNWTGFVQGAQWYANVNTQIDKPLQDKNESFNPNDNNPAEPSMELVVNGEGINVRSGAGLEHRVVRKASKGDRYKVLAVKDGWYKVGNGEWIFYNPSWIKIDYNVPNKEEQKPKDDITGGWFEGHIRKLHSLGIMQGEGNGIFAPYRNVTRAEFAALISNALKLPEGDKSFVDINKAHPSLHSGIKRSASAGIISGRGGGIFDPNAQITREEAAVMIDKALQYKGITGNLVALPFKDQHEIIYKQSVQRLYSLKVVTGVEDNRFNPKGTTTRGEAAAFLVKMLDSMQK
ncbi:S-layer homology domain-containing protein [Bacillus cereus group sp. Bce001]|uniref:S-layer homology domain-containing protein n=1 Tax=Bacillus cereus group sp. Bce001 TaxID=3445260 RepID=UPI003F24650B